MNSFKNWFVIEGFKELQRKYISMLKDVPQDINYHPEGDALVHTKLVRKAVPKAINNLKLLRKKAPFDQILSDLDFNINDEELNILYISAWLHDIGKSTSTTIGGVDFNFLRQFDLLYQNDPSKIRSIGHDQKYHYLPAIKSLSDVAPEQTKNLYIKNSDLINFLIDHHMNFTRPEGFSNSFIKENFLKGKAINNKKLKLLLILMWSDKMGRTGETIQKALDENEKKLIIASQKSLKFDAASNKKKSNFLNSQDMIKNLFNKGLGLKQILFAVKGKFPEVDEEYITKIIRSL